jgi:hypothetical protein
VFVKNVGSAASNSDTDVDLNNWLRITLLPLLNGREVTVNYTRVDKITATLRQHTLGATQVLDEEVGIGTCMIWLSDLVYLSRATASRVYFTNVYTGERSLRQWDERYVVAVDDTHDYIVPFNMTPPSEGWVHRGPNVNTVGAITGSSTDYDTVGTIKHNIVWLWEKHKERSIFERAFKEWEPDAKTGSVTKIVSLMAMLETLKNSVGAERVVVGYQRNFAIVTRDGIELLSSSLGGVGTVLVTIGSRIEANLTTAELGERHHVLMSFLLTEDGVVVQHYEEESELLAEAVAAEATKLAPVVCRYGVFLTIATTAAVFTNMAESSQRFLLLSAGPLIGLTTAGPAQAVIPLLLSRSEVCGPTSFYDVSKRAGLGASLEASVIGSLFGFAATLPQEWLSLTVTILSCCVIGRLAAWRGLIEGGPSIVYRRLTVPKLLRVIGRGCLLGPYALTSTAHIAMNATAYMTRSGLQKAIYIVIAALDALVVFTTEIAGSTVGCVTILASLFDCSSYTPPLQRVHTGQLPLIRGSNEPEFEVGGCHWERGPKVRFPFVLAYFSMPRTSGAHTPEELAVADRDVLGEGFRYEGAPLPSQEDEPPHRIVVPQGCVHITEGGYLYTRPELGICAPQVMSGPTDFRPLLLIPVGATEKQPRRSG